MQGLGPGSLLGAAREAAYGEISAEARQLGKAEIVGMDTWEHEGEDESKMTPRERARYRARKGRRFLREADEARSPEQKASLKTDFRRQLGPSVPSIDPYGSYHLPLQYDTDRLPYGARPADDEPHIVLEYRELIPKLDKHCVRLCIRNVIVVRWDRWKRHFLSALKCRLTGTTASRWLKRTPLLRM